VRIAVLGGGPGGLYFAALAKQLDVSHDITVWERNAADDTFGFGVVFSDETLGGVEHADVEIFHAMRREFARWDDIDVHFRGTTFTSGGHGFAAMSRKRLLAIRRPGVPSSACGSVSAPRRRTWRRSAPVTT
jgi:anthraniloyl-CoA monooxygenase